MTLMGLHSSLSIPATFISSYVFLPAVSTMICFINGVLAKLLPAFLSTFPYINVVIHSLFLIILRPIHFPFLILSLIVYSIMFCVHSFSSSFLISFQRNFQRSSPAPRFKTINSFTFRFKYRPCLCPLQCYIPHETLYNSLFFLMSSNYD